MWFLCVVTGQDESIKPSALKSELYCNEAIEFVLFYCIVIVMVHSIVLLLIFGGVVPCCISAAPSVRGNYTELFRGYSLEQRIAYRIGQVECLKSLQDSDAPLGLGSLHRGNYSRDVSRFALKQRIAFLLGQVNCLSIHLNLDHPTTAPTTR